MNSIAEGCLTRLNLSYLTIPNDACYIKVWLEMDDTRSRYLQSGYLQIGYVDNF